VAEDLHPIGRVRAQALARPQDAHFAPVVAAGLARATVALEVAAQVVQKPGSLTSIRTLVRISEKNVRELGESLVYATASRIPSGMSKLA
jgi:hypothetical protein